MAKKKVCVIKGDDASPEFVIPTVEILEGMRLGIEFFWPLTGDEGIQKYGNPFPSEAKKAVDEADCTLFGSTRGMAGGLGSLGWEFFHDPIMQGREGRIIRKRCFDADSGQSDP